MAAIVVDRGGVAAAFIEVAISSLDALAGDAANALGGSDERTRTFEARRDHWIDSALDALSDGRVVNTAPPALLEVIVDLTNSTGRYRTVAHLLDGIVDSVDPQVVTHRAAVDAIQKLNDKFGVRADPGCRPSS